MGDLLFLLGTGLCVLSVIVAIISVLRTQAPRGAAILFVIGVVLIGAAAWLEPGSVGFDQLGPAWNRVFS